MRTAAPALAAWIGGMACLAGPAAHSASLCLDHPLRIAYYDSGFFYSQGKGVDADLVAELQRRSTCAVETAVLPRARAYALLESGKIDIVMAAVDTPSRKQYAYFAPYLQQRFAAIIHPRVPADKATLEGFSADPALHFGVVRSVSYGDPRDQWTRRMAADKRLQTAPNPAIAYKMLQGGRFSALFAIPLQYEKDLAEAGLRDQVRIVDWFPQEAPTTRNLALSRHHFTEEQLKAWSALLKKLRTDGTMQTMLQRYLSPAEAAKAVPK